MKKFISTLGLATFMVLLMASFTNPGKNQTFTVDTQRSSIEWLGKKVTGEHKGMIKLSSGQLELNGNTVKGGAFTIDMNSITCTDLQGEYGQKLVGHLKADDFFAVDKNPTSKFQITKVTSAGANRVNITGDLTIKGITNSITFPASVKKDGNVVVAVAKGVKIDRTKYDIKYNSKSFFSSIGDKAIEDEFELAINLVAKK
ncbi:MAG: YceI family protein [Daejeonella sp.]